ncbi:hypothetical protein SAMN05421666_2104 [Roseovarius nanhaiticus]|uniref:Uncharacterized protein n=1 Tax=Roseovarius nanhaiticus TaxID=573024 RepID=A0A1N7GV02_9RHOB|nr:hypothetical protein [Roseovarius nanhaiticus]SEL31205.1 hypothetical protein SAMN05216208_3404 [Roseovarius nanhaiticus]SIS16376.1 hypothetical protein SAMN05421666_2104 [Roseovarius nanhaiticus]
MGLVLGFLIGMLILMWRVWTRRAAAAQRAPRAKREWPTWRRASLWAGAAAFIIACEAFLPSMRLTGREVPPIRTPLSYLDVLAAPSGDAGRTGMDFGDLSEAQPWLWSLGRIDRAEMQRRISDDIAEAAARAEAFRIGDVPGRAGSILYMMSRRAVAYDLLGDGLTAAAADLDALFDPGRDSASVGDADAFILRHLDQAIDTAHEKAAALHQEATAASMAYAEARGLDPDDRSDPEYARLRSEESALGSAAYSVLNLRYELNGVAPTGVGLRQPPDTETGFPVLGGKVTLLHQDQRSSRPEEAVIGPVAEFAFGRSARMIWDAARGHARAPRRIEAVQECAVIPPGGARPPGARFCEMAAVLPIDYDLTASRCAPSALPMGSVPDLVLPGTRLSPSGCKEEWIFPHLHILYEEGAFTIFAPMASGMTGPGTAIPSGDAAALPISEWSVIWNGKTRRLTPAARFDWNGVDPVLDRLQVIHGIRGEVQQPRIWRDFRVDATRPLTLALAFPRAEARHAYSPTRITRFGPMQRAEFAPNVLAPGRPAGAPTPVRDWRAPMLRDGIQARLDALNHLARFAPPTGQEPASAADNINAPLSGSGCDYFRFAVSRSADETPREDVRAALDAAQAGRCDAIKAHGALLTALERGLADGSWLWLAEER